MAVAWQEAWGSLGGTADAAHLVPRFVWAVLIVGTSPIGGLVYLLAQRLRSRSPGADDHAAKAIAGKRSMVRSRARGVRRSPAAPVSHGVAAVVISAVVYLVLAGKVMDASAVTIVLVTIVFFQSTAPEG